MLLLAGALRASACEGVGVSVGMSVGAGVGVGVRVSVGMRVGVGAGVPSLIHFFSELRRARKRARR